MEFTTAPPALQASLAPLVPQGAPAEPFLNLSSPQTGQEGWE